MLLQKTRGQHQGFFFFHSVIYNHTGNHPQEELANFGYRSNRKVENLRTLLIFQQPAGTYCLSIVPEFFFLKILQLQCIFLQRKSFVQVTLDFFLTHPKKKKKRRMISISKSRIHPC